MTARTFNEQLLIDDLLICNNQGWKFSLFQNVDEEHVCGKCHNVCRDAVELHCNQHSDDDIFQLYCEVCLRQLLVENGNKCPISNHSKPKYTANRMARRHILKSMVICPYSEQYLNIEIPGENENESKNVIIDQQQLTADECGFYGCLNYLLVGHIRTCIHNDTKYKEKLHSVIIKDLQQKNTQMQEQLQSISAKYNKLEREMRAMKKRLDNGGNGRGRGWKGKGNKCNRSNNRREGRSESRDRGRGRGRGRGCNRGRGRGRGKGRGGNGREGEPLNPIHISQHNNNMNQCRAENENFLIAGLYDVYSNSTADECTAYF